MTMNQRYGLVTPLAAALVIIAAGLISGILSLILAFGPDHTTHHEPAPQRTNIATWHTGHDDGLKVALDIYAFSGSSIDASLSFTNEGKTSVSIIAVRLYVGEEGMAWENLAKFDTPAFGQMLWAGEQTTFAFTGTAAGTGSRLVVQILYRGLDVESGIDHDQELFFEVIVPIPEGI